MGGIAYDGRALFVAEGDTKKVGVIKKEYILGAINVASQKKAKSVSINKVEQLVVDELESASYCTYFDDMLWIGSFNRKEVSKIYGYTIQYGTNTKITKNRYIEAPKKTQGIAFSNMGEKIYMAVSTSYGRKNDSVIRCYRITRKEYYEPKEKYNGILQIKKGNAYRTITLPPMGEGICISGVYMYYISESAARIYAEGLDDKGTSERQNAYFCMFSINSIFK